MMKAPAFLLVSAILMVFPGSPVTVQSAQDPNEPRFSADNELQRPENYREWVWISSGLGMSYGPAAEAARNADPRFDNVFVTPSAYRSFMQTGTWPDKTMFVLELRSSITKGSINQGGRFQGELLAVEVEVKDQKRFPGGWGFFGFAPSVNSVRQMPASATCYSCHAQNGAVDNTFVQFYPTLYEVAKQKGTLKSPPPESTSTPVPTP